MDSAVLICQEKKEAFEKVPLSRRTVTRRVEDIAENLQLQLKSGVGSFDFFSLALDDLDDFLHCLANGHCYVKILFAYKTMWYLNRKFKFKTKHCGVNVTEKELQMLPAYHCFAQFH